MNRLKELFIPMMDQNLPGTNETAFYLVVFRLLNLHIGCFEINNE